LNQTSRLKLSEGGGGNGLAGGLCTFAQHLCRLVTTEAATPLTTLILVLVREVGLCSTDDGGQLALVLTLDVLNGQGSSSLLVDNGAEAGLALDNEVGDTHLSAEGWKVDNQLNWVNIVSNDDQGGLLGLDEGNSVVETVLDEEGLFRFLCFSVGGFLCGSSETSLLLLLGLGSVLVKQLEKLSGGVLVQGVGELGNGRGNLQTALKDDLLPLKANVLRPFHESGEVSGGLNVLTNTKVLWGGFE